MDRVKALVESAQARYNHLSRRTRILFWGWIALQWILLGWLAWYTPKRLFQKLADWANELHETKGGWLLLAGLITLTSFPPMFGFSTCITICGFTYGLRDGLALAILGTLSGAMASFLLARLLLDRYAQKMLDGQTTLKALGSAIKEKGLPLIVLIRLCPFPYSYSNFFFATVQEVSLWQFFLATCALSIKLLLHVYIGTRIYLFSDPEHRESMDTTTKVLNGLSVAASMALGIGVGVYVYRLTMRYVGEGRVALVEEDLERFLEEENVLSDDESGPPGRLHSQAPHQASRVAGSTFLALPAEEVDGRASGEWDVGLDPSDDEDDDDGQRQQPNSNSGSGSGIELVDTKK